MGEEKVIDPVELDLCDYQEVEPVHPLFLLREDINSLIEVSPYEALIIKDASKIGTVESLPTPGPQLDVLAPSEIPTQTQESPFYDRCLKIQAQEQTLIFSIWTIG